MASKIDNKWKLFFNYNLGRNYDYFTDRIGVFSGESLSSFAVAVGASLSAGSVTQKPIQKIFIHQVIKRNNILITL